MKARTRKAPAAPPPPAPAPPREGPVPVSEAAAAELPWALEAARVALSHLDRLQPLCETVVDALAKLVAGERPEAWEIDAFVDFAGIFARSGPVRERLAATVVHRAIALAVADDVPASVRALHWAVWRAAADERDASATDYQAVRAEGEEAHRLSKAIARAGHEVRPMTSSGDLYHLAFRPQGEPTWQGTGYFSHRLDCWRAAAERLGLDPLEAS